MKTDYKKSIEEILQPHLASAITHGYNDAQVDNDGLGEVCRLEAQQNLRNAVMEVESLIEKARDEGYVKGYQEGSGAQGKLTVKRKEYYDQGYNKAKEDLIEEIKVEIKWLGNSRPWNSDQGVVFDIIDGLLSNPINWHFKDSLKEEKESK